jgi:hypothetical protein
MDRRIVGTAVVALLIGGAIVFLVLRGGGGAPGGDKVTPVDIFNGPNTQCEFDSKQPIVRVGRGRAVQWVITNYCSDSATVSVGNFRRDASTSANNCDAAGPDFPFPGNQDPARRTVDVGGNGDSKTITLANAQNTSGTVLELYYDICRTTASQPLRKLDPRLWVE